MPGRPSDWALLDRNGAADAFLDDDLVNGQAVHVGVALDLARRIPLPADELWCLEPHAQKAICAKHLVANFDPLVTSFVRGPRPTCS